MSKATRFRKWYSIHQGHPAQIKAAYEAIIELEDVIGSILSIEEEGHRFDSDEALAEIFNKCREALSK